jgi:hypothetical protein
MAIPGSSCENVLTLRSLTRQKLKPNGCRKVYTHSRSTTQSFTTKTRAYNKSLTPKRHLQQKRTTLNTQDGDKYHGGAAFWSPWRLREARSRKATKQDKVEAEQLQKIQDKELKAAATLYKQQQAEAAKVACHNAAEKKRKANKAQAAELAA